MISNQMSAMSRFAMVGALSLLCIAPSRSFVVPVCTKRLPSPLLASTTSGRLTAVGDRGTRNRNVLHDVSLPIPSVTEDEGVRAPALGIPLEETISEAVPSAMPENPPQLMYGDTAARSFVKALVWRLTAAVVTLVSGLVFSGNLATAMSIVGSDFLTKSGFMFLGERLWNRVKWGQGKSGDSAQRSLAKAMLWRLFAASNTLVCGVFLARDLSVASKIAGTDTLLKTGLFFANERIWSTINWGKKYEPEYFI